MPEVVRGVRSREAHDEDGSTPATPVASPTGEGRGVHFDSDIPPTSPLSETPSRSGRRKSSQSRRERRESIERVEQDVYYDSRAATKREFRRRASTLQQYYKENPDLLPQLPFTFRHGFKRWKLVLLITIMVIDACVIPLALYYAMTFAGHVAGWIVFAIVATIWGGPTYVEFAVRSWRLIKKENFFRPLGSDYRWGFDITHWIFTLTIGAVTAFLVVGSAPHIVFIRVLSMPGPAILITLGGPLWVITMYSLLGWPAPFRISSTAKGDPVLPGVYYLMEDIVAVNAAGGRPFREGLAARYEASPIFRRMMLTQSLFWSIPALLVAFVCTVLVCVHEVPKNVGYGIGWGVPFVWAGLWAAITIPWVRSELRKETDTWEMSNKVVPPASKTSEMELHTATP